MKKIKCTVVGDASTQKTAMLISFTTNTYPGEYIPTVFDNYCANMLYKDTPVRFELHDIAPQEDYKKLRPLSYFGTDVFIATFHLAQPTTLEDVERVWIPEVTEHCPGVPIILVGTCCECIDNPSLINARNGDRIITNDEIRAVMKRNKVISDYISCSALKAINLSNVFDLAVESVLEGTENFFVRCEKAQNLALLIGDISGIEVDEKDKELLLINADDLASINRKPSILVIAFDDHASINRSLGRLNDVYRTQNEFERTVLVQNNGIERFNNTLDSDLKYAKRLCGTKTFISTQKDWDWIKLRDAILDADYNYTPANEDIDSQECRIA